MPEIETPKMVLTRQAEIPKLALMGSPVAAMGEGLSGVLASFAQSVPDLAAPALPGTTGVGGPPNVPDFLKSIQASLPGGGPPQLGGGQGQATIGPKVENAKAPAARAFKIGV